MVLLLVLVALTTVRAGQSINSTVEAIPPAASNSGGGCFAHMTQTGSFRVSVLNPLLSTTIRQNAPFSSASSSGGTTFHLRYLVFIFFQSSMVWSYPCFLLHASYAQICTFHASFGGLANCCLAEYYEVVSLAVNTIYGNLILTYGGPLGGTATYASTFFAYIKNLPIQHGTSLILKDFGKQYCGFTSVNGRTIQTQWVLTFAIDNPSVASRGAAPYNYGWQSMLGHYATGFSAHSAVRFPYYENLTLTFASTASSNLQGQLILLPALIVAKSWDSTGRTQSILRIFSIVLAYVTTKRLILGQQLMVIHSAPFCSSGCPVVDGAAADSLPFTQSVSYAVYSKLRTSIAPSVYPIVGPSSSLTYIKFLNGRGALEIWNGAGTNFCPFDNIERCVTLNRVLSLLGGLAVREDAETLHSLKSAYQIWLPDNQICSPVCGDPIQIDLLEAGCMAANYCNLLVAILPSIKAQIPFTTETVYAVIALMSLASTALSAHFVHAFLPASLFKIPYFEHLDQWFPNYSFFGAGKGGFAFNKESGNSLMDYITYLTERIGAYFSSSDGTAYVQGQAQCSYSRFLRTVQRNIPQSTFQRQMRQTI